MIDFLRETNSPFGHVTHYLQVNYPKTDKNQPLAPNLKGFVSKNVLPITSWPRD